MTSFGHSKPCQKTMYIYASLSSIISLIKLMRVNYAYNNKKNLTWIFMKGTGCYSIPSFQSILCLEVKPVRFHLYLNFYSDVKPDELAHFRTDSLRKPSRTNRRASAQLPYSEAKPDKPVRFHTKSFPRLKQAILVHSQCESTF